MELATAAPSFSDAAAYLMRYKTWRGRPPPPYRRTGHCAPALWAGGRAASARCCRQTTGELGASAARPFCRLLYTACHYDCGDKRPA